VLRVIAIGEQELWYDEAQSAQVAMLNSTFADALRTNNSPPLYYLLLKAWIALAGSSERGLRLLSACLGTLTVASLIVAGRRFFGTRVGLWSAAAMALFPIHVYYSQEARGYALLTLLLLWSYMLLWRALESNSWIAWFQTSAVAVLALYTHYVAVFGLLPSVALLMLWPRPRAGDSRWFRFIVAMALCVLCVLPWILWCFVFQSYSFSGGDFIRQIWLDTPLTLAIPKSLEVLTLGPDVAVSTLPKVYDVLKLPPQLRIAGLTLLGLLAVWVTTPWGDGNIRVPWLERRKIWLWSWLLLPLVALGIVSLYKPLYLVGRYDMIALPAAALVVGLALSKLQCLPRQGRLLAPCAALALLGIFGVKLLQYYQLSFSHPATPSNRAVARLLAEQAKPGDAVVLSQLRGVPILYYLHRLGLRWERGECVHEDTGARFICRLFHPEDERWLGNPADPLPESSFARSMVVSLRGSDNILWVLAEPKYVSDALLLTELDKLNLISVADVAGLLRYRLR